MLPSIYYPIFLSCSCCSDDSHNIPQWWWVPIVAPFVGATIAAFVYWSLIEAHHPQTVCFVLIYMYMYLITSRTISIHVILFTYKVLNFTLKCANPIPLGLPISVFPKFYQQKRFN